MATRVRSYSKINLGLAIGPVRDDGFHGLVTLYQTLALCDVVTVGVQKREFLGVSGQVVGGSAREATQALKYGDSGLDEAESRMTPSGVGGISRITLTTNHPGVPTDGRNTAWKIMELALERLGVTAEVAIHIEKELPVQGGMGAGSANAAAALLGLERELGVEVPGRMEIAAEVGSDVPLFLVGGAVLGTGRGELVSEMPDFAATWCVVAVPEVGVSTPRAFRDWDEIHQPTSQNRDVGQPDSSGRLTSATEPDTLSELSHAYASVFGVRPSTASASDTSGIVRGPISSPGKQQAQGDTRNDLAEGTLLALVRTGIENDFEQVVFPQYPLLREIKHELMGISVGSSTTDGPADSSGVAIYAARSGSGSALFGLYRSETDAKAAQQRVQATGCKALLTKTLPRQEYWRRMFAE